MDKNSDDPINDVQVKIEDITDEHNSTTYTIYTDGDGYYEQDLLYAGAYVVIFERIGYETEERFVDIGEGELLTLNMYLDRDGTHKKVRGVVMDGKDGSPINDAFLRLTGLSCNCSFQTESSDNGSFTFPEVPHGDFSMVVEKEGYERYQETIVIPEEGDGLQITINLTRIKAPGLVIDSIEFSDMHPEAGDRVTIEITITNENDSQRSAVLTTTDNSDGMLTVVVTIAEFNVTVQGGKTASFTVEWDTTGQKGENIISAVLDDDEETLVQETITVEPPSDGLGIKSITFSDGHPAVGDLVTIEIEVKNNDDERRSAALTIFDNADGDMDAEVLLLYNEITLDGGQTATYTVEWNTTGQAGDNIITAMLDDDSDRSLSETIYVEERGDLGVKLFADRTKITVEDEEYVVISVTVENTGEMTDTYTLSVAYPSDSGWEVAVDVGEVTLGPGDSRTFAVTVTPLRNAGGSLNVQVSAVSQTDSMVYDHIYLSVDEGDDDTSPLPGFGAPVVMVGIGLGVVAFFRRRGLDRGRKIQAS